MRVFIGAFLAIFALSPQFIFASTIGDGNILVLDRAAGSVRQFSSSGADLGIFVTSLETPTRIATDGSLNVYVIEPGRVEKFSSGGTSMMTISTPYTASALVVGADGSIFVSNGLGVFRYDATGGGGGLFYTFIPEMPTNTTIADLALDSRANLYVSVVNDDLVRRVSPEGNDLGVFKDLGLVKFVGLAVDSQDNVWISNAELPGVAKYSPTGQFLAGNNFFPDIQGHLPTQMAVDRDDNVLILDGIFGVRELSPTAADLGILVPRIDGMIDIGVARVPEPGTLALLGSGLVLMAAIWARVRPVSG